MEEKELEKIRKKKKEELQKKMSGEKKKVIEVNDANFQEKVIEESKQIPVVVDFWAPWCQPCLMLSPILEKLAQEFEGKFILAKINLDQNKETAQNYGITSIPSVKMFQDGKVMGEFLGARPEPMVKEWLQKNL